jgi:Homeodomain-like domain
MKADISAEGVNSTNCVFSGSVGTSAPQIADRALVDPQRTYATHGFKGPVVRCKIRAQDKPYINKTLGRPRLAPALEQRISAALKARKDTGDSVRKIAKRFGVDPGTVQRISSPLSIARVAPCKLGRLS